MNFSQRYSDRPSKIKNDHSFNCLPKLFEFNCLVCKSPGKSRSAIKQFCSAQCIRKNKEIEKQNEIVQTICKYIDKSTALNMLEAKYLVMEIRARFLK